MCVFRKKALPLILLFIATSSHAYYWETEIVSDGCSLSTAVRNDINPKAEVSISFSIHPKGNNQYLSDLGINSKYPFVTVVVSGFSYRELVDNTNEILNVTIDNKRGIEYTGKKNDISSDYVIYYFGNETYSYLYEKAKNRQPFAMEFFTKKGVYKTSLNFIYDFYGEDLLFNEKSKEFEDCINTHNKSLKNGTPQDGVP